IIEVIKSKHIKFDAETIWARLKSKEFWKELKNIIPYGKGFPRGEVFGFATFYKNKRIIFFGSLYHKYKEILEQYKNCDIFIAPLAGNSKKHLAKKGGQMIDILKPKIVIPIHWDDFFPPISREEDLKPFHLFMKQKHPDIKVLMLEIDKETIIE
ncbi:MAG: MBL fold metallo-hydrolase, partial [Promethearchaeota archaeon]